MSKTGKPTSFIEQARRQQIIEATIHCLATEGYARTSLAKVARRAKVSKSVLLYYFVGKDKLIEAAAETILKDLGNFITPRLEAEETARGQLRAYLQAEFSYLEQHRPRLLAISTIMVNHRDRRGSLRLQEETEALNLEGWGEILEYGQKTGEFRSFAIRPMATTLIHAINGALAQSVADPTYSLTEYARELMTIFELATQNSKKRNP